jgi:hypothetical protein
MKVWIWAHASRSPDPSLDFLRSDPLFFPSSIFATDLSSLINRGAHNDMHPHVNCRKHVWTIRWE